MTDSPKSPQKMGRGMLYIFWLLVLGGLAVVFSNTEKNRINPNQSASTSSTNDANYVELKRNAYGHYVTSGRINGSNVVFMLDTGATDVAIPSSVAKRLNLVRGKAHQVHTANGTARAYRTEIQSLEVGNIRLSNIRASITPGMHGNDILLGMSALKQLDFRQAGDTLTLTQHLN